MTVHLPPRHQRYGTIDRWLSAKPLMLPLLNASWKPIYLGKRIAASSLFPFYCFRGIWYPILRFLIFPVNYYLQMHIAHVTFIFLFIYVYFICTPLRFIVIILIIVSGGDWLWKPANVKVENNGAVGYVGSSLTVHNPLYFVHKLSLDKLMRCFYWSVSSKW